jgi:hypothetical protein
MSDFEKLKLEELKAAADYFGTEIDTGGVTVSDARKEELYREALDADGITLDMYQTFVAGDDAAEAEEGKVVDKPTRTGRKTGRPSKAAQEQVLLVKMTRDNFRYDIMGFTFTKDHPFKVIPVGVANRIFQTEGFRPATPAEAEEFYA